MKALQAAGVRQRDELRQVGDLSLFISGFFSDSLNRSLVDVDYYIQLGEHAYGSLARQGDGTFGDVFDELAGKFPAFVDVLGEVSERTRADVERRPPAPVREVAADQEPPQRRSARGRGIVPNASVGSRFIQ